MRASYWTISRSNLTKQFPVAISRCNFTKQSDLEVRRSILYLLRPQSIYGIAMAEQQNYSNHRRFVPPFHFFLALVILATLIGAAINFFKSMDGSGLYSASLILTIALANIFIFHFLRSFALKAQDRAIRVEENLRNYVRNGSLLDSRLEMRQIIGLRFASDDEYDDLAARAVNDGLSESDIKKAITNWKGDHERA